MRGRVGRARCGPPTTTGTRTWSSTSSSWSPSGAAVDAVLVLHDRDVEGVQRLRRPPRGCPARPCAGARPPRGPSTRRARPSPGPRRRGRRFSPSTMLRISDRVNVAMPHCVGGYVPKKPNDCGTKATLPIGNERNGIINIPRCSNAERSGGQLNQATIPDSSDKCHNFNAPICRRGRRDAQHGTEFCALRGGAATPCYPFACCNAEIMASVDSAPWLVLGPCGVNASKPPPLTWS